jgi:hypothetical protein
MLKATSSPTFNALRGYQGFILSSKSVHTEFDFEAIKHIAHLQFEIRLQWKVEAPSA